MIGANTVADINGSNNGVIRECTWGTEAIQSTSGPFDVMNGLLAHLAACKSPGKTCDNQRAETEAIENNDINIA